MITFAILNIEDLSVKFASTLSGVEGNIFTAQEADDLNDLTGPQAVAFYNVTAKELDTGLTPVTRFADKKSASKRLWANLVDLEEKRRVDEQMDLKDVAENGPFAASVLAKKARDAAAPAKATDYPAPAQKARRSQGINLKPQKKVYPCREGSKQAVLVDALMIGASMNDLLRHLEHGKPWKEVTVKSGLNWDMNKVKGYGIRTTFENGYERWLACDWDSMGDFRLYDFDGHPDDNSSERKAELLKRNIEDGFDPDKRDVAVYWLVLPEGMTAPLPHTPRSTKKAK